MNQHSFFSRANEETLLAEADFHEEEARQQAGKCHVPHKDQKPKKRIQITTLEAWERLLPTLPDRERLILHGLSNYIETARKNRWTSEYRSPTAYELFRALKPTHDVFDINSVRPVLTRLKDKGLVEFGVKRKCNVTRETAYTWRFPEQVQGFLFKEHENVTS
jgi:hypothetical protein